MFEMTQKVLFKHCDPAGIVFFPRYFEMINDCVETFFDQGLGWPFETLLIDAGVPTVSIATDFVAPSRHGDILTLSLAVTRLGQTSLTYDMTATCRAETRFRATATIVHVVSGPGRPAPWPEHVRSRLAAFAAP
ncbi:MAG: thioesterase family protein [Jannaschia sp.]